MNVNTLRPGLLVSLKTSIVGNTEYRRLELEADHLTEDGSKRARWETERTVTDPAERERASEVRSKCRTLVYRCCAASTFGLLCPEDKREELSEAVEQAQALTAEFNSTAALTRVGVYVIVGRIAADDLEAAKAINSEVRDLLSEMAAGVKELDVQKIRQAAYKAKSIGRMLSPDASERLQTAVEAARAAARKIVKAGEEAAIVIDRQAVRKITESRTMFLDLDEAGSVEVATPTAQPRGVDLEPGLPLEVPQPKHPQIEV